MYAQSAEVVVVEADLLPALPEPQTSTLPALLEACDAVVEWANDCTDLGLVREVYDRFSAVAEYLSRRDAAREANVAMRRLEVRIGQLLGPAEVGANQHSAQAVPREVQLPRNRANEFRRMAANPAAVEEMLAESTEEEPASRRQVLKALTKLERTVRNENLAAQEPPIRGDAEPDVFATIVVDPPWQYDNVATRGAAEDHYPTMTLGQLADLDLRAADNAHLYLWVTKDFLHDGFHLLETWGFTYKAILTWCKPQIGMGNYFRNNTEFVLFGVRGSLPTNANDVPTWFIADRTRHSAKPEYFLDLVEKSSPAPYREMFARRQRLNPNWWYWGNEA